MVQHGKFIKEKIKQRLDGTTRKVYQRENTHKQTKTGWYNTESLSKRKQTQRKKDWMVQHTSYISQMWIAL